MKEIKPQLADIPKDFYSFESGTLFENCLVCNKYLLGPDTQYIIEKAYRRYDLYKTEDVIFEYAMCLDCYRQVASEFSQESMERVQAYFDRNVDLDLHHANCTEQFGNDISKWLEKCIVKGTPIHKMEEYQICGFFNGEKIIYYYLPYLIGGEAIDEIMELLSNKTIGAIDDMMGKYLSPSPEIRDLFRPTPVIL